MRPNLVQTDVDTIDPKTDEKIYNLTNKKDTHGNLKTFQSKKLAETKDAYDLVSDQGALPIERVYADHSNRLKALANEVRKEVVATKPMKRSTSAAQVYANEVASLNSKINEALLKKPLERRAQL